MRYFFIFSPLVLGCGELYVFYILNISSCSLYDKYIFYKDDNSKNCVLFSCKDKAARHEMWYNILFGRMG